MNEEDSAEKAEARNLQNFYLVASRSSSDHLAYRRDLSTLLELSMTISEYSLALDIGKQWLEVDRTRSAIILLWFSLPFFHATFKKSHGNN